ncbi:hypothetical protein ALQ64_102545 [Pseudomonas cannabina]|uniref:Uncharacterized protein n=1 Tax=Pseudomonas cannabina TaxID=86840 RepID=A0A0N8QY53_PSECA|nr:Unknown protein sequence [Pseudomonas cannabina]RMN15758.1 hypothetical protein ALQ64_102545 [Pseudomonas cannabina]
MVMPQSFVGKDKYNTYDKNAKSAQQQSVPTSFRHKKLALLKCI